MRPVAAYSLTRATTGDGTGDLAACRRLVALWLRAKGAEDISVGQREVTYPTGIVAQLQIDQISSEHGALDSFTLTEPVDAGHFETHLDLAQDDSSIVLFCQLRTGSASSALAPVPFDARCPGVVRDLIRMGGWTSGASEASADHVTRIGREAGRQLDEAIWHPDRGLPVVVVSELDGFTLHPNIARDLAHDLAGLATVAQIDDEASWLLSDSKGREWSCYSGALRLYWPFRATRDDPYSHRLWTQNALLRGGVDPETAARRVHRQLHRVIFGQSAFQTTPAIITEIRDEHIAAQRKQAKDADDYVALANDYERENRDFRQDIKDLKEQIREQLARIEDLDAQNHELNVVLQWTSGAAGEAAREPAVVSSTIDTVDDAVQQAMEDCQNLVFGSDVDRGVKGLASGAGPPMKILRYLRTLNEMTRLNATGSLGTTIQHWLRSEDIDVSGENGTVQKSPSEMTKRTWDDGSGSRREFTSHLKPSDRTSPDRCVRIYFDYDNKSTKTIVAWVGRHPA